MAVPLPVQTVEGAKPFLFYPPFPTPPPGAVIIPFTQFQPVGIAVRIDSEAEEAEMDGLGRPTVRLRVRHDLTPSERKKGSKKSGKGIKLDENGQTRKMLWHEEWALHEALDRRPSNPYVVLSLLFRF